MKNTKKNNKGFSLVELIVVVLIMAILAVALAPQVMKWVDRSRQATDLQNYDGLVANAQLALTDPSAYDACKTANFEIKMESSGTTLSSTQTAFDNAMTVLDSGWKNVKSKATTNNSYVITVSGGSIVRTTPPTAMETN